MAPDIIVTLVHGTFARNADWVADESQFCQFLMRENPKGILIRRFSWSGANSFRARFKAAEELARQLDDQIQKERHASHFVVGHSHGGNIILWALRRCVLAQRIAGVACLSTPFLRVQRRSYGRRGWQPLLTLPVAMLIIGALIGWWINRHFLLVNMPWLGLLLFLLLVFFPLLLFAILRPRVLRRAAELESMAGFPLIAPERLCLIRHTGDEALTGLSGAAFFSWITTTIIGWADNVAAAFVRYLSPAVWSQKRFDAWFRTVGILLVIGILLIFLGANISDPQFDFESMDWRKWTGFGIGAMGSLMFLLSCAAMVIALFAYLGKEGIMRRSSELIRLMGISIAVILAMPLLAVLAMPFGPEGLMLGLLLEIVPEATPPGTWQITLLEGKAIDTALRHSAAYNDPEALKRLVQWMKALTSCSEGTEII